MVLNKVSGVLYREEAATRDSMRRTSPTEHDDRQVEGVMLRAGQRAPMRCTEQTVLPTTCDESMTVFSNASLLDRLGGSGDGRPREEG